MQDFRSAAMERKRTRSQSGSRETPARGRRGPALEGRVEPVPTSLRASFANAQECGRALAAAVVSDNQSRIGQRWGLTALSMQLATECDGELRAG